MSSISKQQLEEQQGYLFSLIDDEDDDEDFDYFEDSEEESEDGIGSSSDSIEVIETPFFFGNEEEDLVKVVIKFYFDKLNIGCESCIRRPKPFIGRITRFLVQNNNDSELFCSLDTINVCRRNLLPPDNFIFHPERVFHFLTTYDRNSGVPISSFPLKEEKILNFWKERVVGSARGSFLFCSPLFNESGFKYHSEKSKEDVSYFGLPSNPFLPFVQKYMSTNYSQPIESL